MVSHAIAEAMFPRDQARYAWIIDKDHIADENFPVGSYCHAPGVAGPSDAPPEMIEALNNGQGRKFKMYDDDGELYYTGRIVGDEIPTEGGSLGEDCLGPLDDFGMPNAGCTEIRYRIDGEWKMI